MGHSAPPGVHHGGPGISLGVWWSGGRPEILSAISACVCPSTARGLPACFVAPCGHVSTRMLVASGRASSGPRPPGLRKYSPYAIEHMIS
ncbi:Atp-Dependent Rna Helicase A [Manis pentadactyla]|nr:Atp-Dependent Rna Helicase A [Manis pentadactyla]